MIERVSCPYCNTGIHPSHISDTGRISCPRCGEYFAITNPADAPTVPGGERGILPVSVNGTPPPATPDRPIGLGGLRSLVLLSVGFMVLIAIGFVFFLLPHSAKPKPTAATAPQPKLATTHPPAVLPGLGYLPPQSHFIAAVQPSALGIYAKRTQTEVRELLVKLGLPQPIMAFLDTAAVPLEDVESLVAGLILPDDNAIPQGVFVLTLRKPLQNPAALRAALKAKRSAAPGTGKHEKIEINGLPLELLERDAKTYIIATEGKLLTAAAQQPRIGIPAFSGHLRSELTQLSPASCAWIVTDQRDWSKNPTVKLLAGWNRNPDWPERLSHLRAFAVGLSLEPDLQLKVRLTTDTTDSAAAMRKRIAAHTANVSGNGDRLEITTPIDPAQGFGNLSGIVTDWVPAPQP
ncbi:MAG: hypothetical protein LC104_20470 [Bacteroidales bacterium]|nr:hypothetical protein [Bacteroidales bacterium]